MPLLTIVNLSTSQVSIQDLGGLISINLQGSATITDKVVTEDQLNAIEAQLVALAASSTVRWSVKDNPATVGDSVPAAPGIIDMTNFFEMKDDFPLAGGGTLPAPLGKAVQGSATGDYLNDVACGIYSLATAAVSEAEAAQLTFAEQVLINPTKTPIFEARVRMNIPGATISADERWVVGLCDVHATAQAALDSVPMNVWFRGEGANLNIFVEGDDGVTDTDDVDSTIDYADNVFMTLKIDMTDKTKVKFFVDGVQVPTTVNVNAMAAANLLQPIFCYQRDAGTEINLLEIDWYRVYAAR